MKEDEMIESMLKYGGSFVKALAESMLSADAENYRKLIMTFPEYCQTYREMSQK